MAKNLNQTRIRDTKIVLFIAAFFILFVRPTFADETFLHEMLDLVGYLFIAICALGRIYTTAFLGGHKNKKLITEGPFSIVRNPLYSFSLLGIIGASIMTNQIVAIVFLPIAFIVIYNNLIKREELFLTNEFGSSYTDYVSTTPRLIPDFKSFKSSETTILHPKLLLNAFKDAIWWFAFLPLMELTEYLQDAAILPSYKLF